MCLNPFSVFILRLLEIYSLFVYINKSNCDLLFFPVVLIMFQWKNINKLKIITVQYPEREKWWKSELMLAFLTKQNNRFIGAFTLKEKRFMSPKFFKIAHPQKLKSAKIFKISYRLKFVFRNFKNLPSTKPMFVK